LGISPQNSKMDNLSHNTERDSELKEMPTLKSMPSSPFFNAPDGYFDTLNSQIQDRIQSSGKRTYIIPVFRPAFAGFSFALIIVCIALVYFNGNEQSTNEQQAMLSTPTIDAVIESGYYINLDEELIAETLCDVPVKNDLAPQDPEDIELENYLIQTMNETSLLNEL
jgi:hypothetical protein